MFDNGHANGTMISRLLDRAISAYALAQQLKETCAALDRELFAAAKVQQWILPSTLPTIDDVSIASSYRTAQRSCGDFYDFGKLADGALGLLIADVSGKGAPAAVLTAVVRIDWLS